METAPTNSINQNFAAEFREEIDRCLIQGPEIVAQGLIKILEKAKPGTIWIAENNAEPYEVSFPNVGNMKQKNVDVQ